jgi:DNA helicase-2/ATP-dependent DNA helicase PcrA
MMDEIAAAREAARRLWREQHADEAGLATPVRQIAEDLGVGVEYFAQAEQPQTQGYLDATDDLIWLSDDLAEPVERFTLAHELGHWRLHRDDPERASCTAADISQSLADEHEALLRPVEAYSPRSRREREANAFAAELLAPLTVVRRAYLGQDGQPARSIEQIAGKLGVSRAVIVAQVTQLLARDAALADAPVDEAGEAGASALSFAPDTPAPVEKAPGASALDASQRAAVVAPAPALVVAGPGTGKTSTLVARVRWLIDHGAAPTSILALTFSRKATEELRERLAAALGTDAPDRLPTIATFHQFCGDLLRSYGYLVGLRPDYRLIDDIGGFFLLRDLGNQLPLHHYAALTAPTLFFGALLSAISKAKDELITPTDYRVLAEALADDEARDKALEVAAVYALYQAELERRQDADYGDLIHLTVRLFTEHPDVLASVGAKYAHLLVDEFQDINRANGVLLRHLAGPDGNIWAVGDANQAIYRFRGASPANIANFTEDYPGARVLPLDQNYRSRPAIVAAANRFAEVRLRQGKNPALVELHATRPAVPEEAVRAQIAPDGASEIAALAADIRRRHAEGLAWRDHAVLCRTRAIMRASAAGLSAAGIPAEAQSDLFDDERIKDVLGIAHLLAGEQSGLLRAARVPEHALSRAARQAVLAALRDAQHSIPDALERAQAGAKGADRRHLARLREILFALWRQPTISQALSAYLFDHTALARAALQSPDATTLHLAELLALAGRFDQEQPPTPEAQGDQVTRHWRAFMGFLRAVRGLPRPPSAGATETMPDRVRVLTVHGAKGLEWPVVYLPHLIPGSFPSNNRYDPAPSPAGMAAGDMSDPALEHRLEEACLFYVALTRARDVLVLSRAARYGKRNANASDFWMATLVGSGIEPARLPALATDEEAERAESDLVPDPEDPAFALPAELTSSALTTYDSCPRQYAYRYGYHFAGGRNAFGRLRRAVNDALQSAPDERQAVDAFEAAWQAKTGDSAAEDDPFDALYLRHGRQAVARAYPQVRAPGEEADFTRVVDVAVADTIIHVELDRTEGAASAAPRRVVRHHIGRRAAGDAVSLTTYLALLAQRTLSGDAGADTIIEHHLSEGKIIPVTFTSRQEANLRAKIEAAIQGIRAADFPARPEDRRCAGCEFALICPV